jgi:GDP-L-fucose synthase
MVDMNRKGREMTEAYLDRGIPVFVAGHRGLVGGAVLRHLEKSGFRSLITRTSTDLDLRDPAAVEQFFAAERPGVVVMAAAKVGGIVANNTYPADFLSDNLRMQVNVLDAATRHGVERLLFLGCGANRG